MLHRLSLLMLPFLVPLNPASAAEGIQVRAAAHPTDALAQSFSVVLPQASPLTLTCREVGGDQETHILERPAARTHELALHGLKAATEYCCTATRTDRPELRSAPINFLTAPLPLDLRVPKISVASTDPVRTGYILYNYGTLWRPWRVENRYLVVLDPKGNVRWYFAGDGGGDIDVSFLGNDLFLFGGYHSYSVPPTVVGLDKTIRFRDATLPTTETESANSWNHDAGLSANGDSILYLTYEYREWSSFTIREIEVETGLLLWQWSGILDGFDAGQLEAGTEGSDPYHANSVTDAWEDGRRYIYLGMRNNSAFIKIDYETGEVLWRLSVNGDFELLEADGTPATDDRWFFNHHDSKLTTPTLFSAHDNGTDRARYGGTNYSRALQLELDFDAMTARIAFEYTEPGYVESIWGGYDVWPDGHSLLARTHCWLCTVSNKASIIELDPSAQVVWRADFSNEKEHLYRAERIDGCDLFDNRAMCPNGRSRP